MKHLVSVGGAVWECLGGAASPLICSIHFKCATKDVSSQLPAPSLTPPGGKTLGFAEGGRNRKIMSLRPVKSLLSRQMNLIFLI